MHPRTLICGGFCVTFAILGGCSPKPQPASVAPESAPAENVALRLIVVDDPEMAAVIERQWKARESAELTVAARPWSEVAAAQKLDADAIIYPSGLIGELAERRLIAPFDDQTLAAHEPNPQDVFPQLRLRETRWGASAYAVSFGSPTLTLMYRPDIFAKLELQPPRDWVEYRQAAEKLADRAVLGDLAPPADQPWRGALEPLGPGWAGQALLARAAPYARHRSQYSTIFNFANMTPRIDGPPFVRALEELVDCAPFGSGEAMEFSPADVRRELLAGRCGMALAWPAPAESEQPREDAGAPVAVAFAEAPGAIDVYNHDDQRWEKRRGDDSSRVPLLSIAGRMGSVTTESSHPSAALAALVTLSSAQWSGDVSTRSRGAALFRFSQIESAEKWVDEAIDPAAARQYAETVAQALSRDDSMFSPRLPGRERYLAALDEAVRKAVAGGQKAEESLRSAAGVWREITDQLGSDKQKAAYRRSLGMSR